MVNLKCSDGDVPPTNIFDRGMYSDECHQNQFRLMPGGVVIHRTSMSQLTKYQTVLFGPTHDTPSLTPANVISARARPDRRHRCPESRPPSEFFLWPLSGSIPISLHEWEVYLTSKVNNIMSAWPLGNQIWPCGVSHTNFWKLIFHFIDKSHAAFPFHCMQG